MLVCLIFGKLRHVFPVHEKLAAVLGGVENTGLWLAAVLGGIQMRGSWVVSRRPGRGTSTGAYSGCQMRACSAVLGVARCVGASLLCAHCRLLACCMTAGLRCSSAKGTGLWLCICWSSRAACRMRTGLMMNSLHQRHRFLHRRRRCLRRVRCLFRLHGLWYLLALRRRRFGTIRTSRMSITFRAMPRPTGNQEIGHLLETSAPRYPGDTSLVGCSSPLAVWSSRGLSSPVSPGLCSGVLILSHALIYVFFWFTLVVAAVPGGIQIRGSRSLVCKAAAAFSLTYDDVLNFVFFLPRVVNDGFGTVRMCVAGGEDANVYTCFSVGGTGLNACIVRLFYIVGCIEVLWVVLIFCFSPGGSGPAFLPRCCVPARWVRRGVVLCAGGPDVFVVVERSLRFSCPCPHFCVVFLVLGSAAVPGGVEIRGSQSWHICDIYLSWFAGDCRRPGRGRDTGLSQLAHQQDLRV